MMRKRKTFLYNVEYDDTMFRSEANKTQWLVLLSILYVVILAIILIRHLLAENVDTDVTKYTMPIMIALITIAWLLACVFLMRKRTILIDENGFLFQRLRKIKTYSWDDVKEVDVNKSKNGKYIVVTFNDDSTYGTGYAKEIEDIIKKYCKKD